MKMLHYPIFALVFLFVGCQSDKVIDLDPNERPPTMGMEEPTKAEIQKDRQMIGLSLGEAERVAKSRNLTSRVVSKDGNHLMVTSDYQTHRVNFTIVKGKVVKVSRG